LAEKRIAEYQPDVVVLDIMMPKLDGLTLLKRIRDHGDWQGIKVIIHSAKSFAVDRRRALELGADLFLAKPTSANKFIASIRGLIEVVAH
jgi:DNA-binding response OmpR family regulator